MTEKSNVQAVHDTLLEEFRRDDRVMILGEDVGKRGGVFRVTDGFIEEFGPLRVLDTPLAEAAIVGVAIGLALAGFRPIAEMQFADFSTPAFDQIVQEAARIRYRSNGHWGVPMVIRMPWGAGVRGALYHSQSLEAFYAHVPGLKVVAPSTPKDITGMLRAAIRDPDPVIFLEHKATYRAVKGDVPDGDWTIPLGPADVKREGTDITVFAYGLMLHHCLKAAEALAGDGISAAIRRPSTTSTRRSCGTVDRSRRRRRSTSRKRTRSCRIRSGSLRRCASWPRTRRRSEWRRSS